MKSNARLPNTPNASNLEALQLKSLSCFDLDHTLLKGNSSTQLGFYLYRQGIFSCSTLLYMLGIYGLHKCGCISVVAMQTRIFKHLFAGIQSDLIHKYAAQFLDQYFDQMVYMPALKCLREAQAAGQYTVILSSSPDFLVKLIADRLGVDAWDATAYGLDAERRFTKIERFVLGEDKARYMTALSQKLGIAKQAITAYSDSILDLSFLQAAGSAVAVNPDHSLKVLCRRNQWPIL